ncbi:MAG: TPR repeat protein [Paracoccaceae bacterium]|jgi:TPR repeat protein
MAKIRTVVRSGALALLLALFATQTVYASAQKGIQAFQRGKYEEALKYLQPAAEAGDASAMYVLGQMYASGRGITKDEKAATDLFLKAANLGDPNAQQSLGSALMLGEGIEQDMVEALKWFIISGRAGNKDALSYTKTVGRFLSRDMQREARGKALEWQKANAKKDADAKQ